METESITAGGSRKDDFAGADKILTLTTETNLQ